jgi:hypothetical protein
LFTSLWHLFIISTTLERARVPISFAAPKLLRLQSQLSGAFWTIMLLVSTIEPSSPFVAVAPAACPGSRRSELRFSDARNGWTWLDMAAQLAAVVLDKGKSPTSDVPTTNTTNYSPIEATLHPNRAVFLCVLM